jgi:kynurenine formamidase
MLTMSPRRLAAGALAVTLSIAAACSPRDRSSVSEPQRIVDLGHPLAETDPSWSGEKAFTYETVETIAKDGYQAGKFSTEEHFGTHVDAPAHFAAGRWTVDEIPVDRLIRPGVCVNIAAQVRADGNYRLAVDDLKAFEDKNGRIPSGVIVLVATGWDQRWGSTHGEYMNEQNGVKHFPGISVDAAKFLAGDRLVAGIGIDTPSIDYGMSEHFEAHQVTLAMDLFHIENATGLTQLPATGFMVVVAPMKIKGGSGAPARLFAVFSR